MRLIDADLLKRILYDKGSNIDPLRNADFIRGIAEAINSIEKVPTVEIGGDYRIWNHYMKQR